MAVSVSAGNGNVVSTAVVGNEGLHVGIALGKEKAPRAVNRGRLAGGSNLLGQVMWWISGLSGWGWRGCRGRYALRRSHSA